MWRCPPQEAEEDGIFMGIYGMAHPEVYPNKYVAEQVCQSLTRQWRDRGRSVIYTVVDLDEVQAPAGAQGGT